MLKLLRNLKLTDRQLLVMLQEAYVKSDRYYLCPTVDKIPNIWWFQRRRLNDIINSYIDHGYSTLNRSSFARVLQMQSSGKALRLFFLQTLIEDLEDRND